MALPVIADLLAEIVEDETGGVDDDAEVLVAQGEPKVVLAKHSPLLLKTFIRPCWTLYYTNLLAVWLFGWLALQEVLLDPVLF